MTFDRPHKPSLEEIKAQEKELARAQILSLIEGRDDWDSNIPVEIVHDGQYKVRKNWFQGIITSLYLLQEYGFIGPSIYKRAAQLITEVAASKFTTAEHVKRGDDLINEAVEEAEKNLNK